MLPDWADKTARQLLDRGWLSAKDGGICLILGAVDTGKTTLALALAKRLAIRETVGIIDADVGQSHIGPPATVGWAAIDSPQIDLSQLTAAGIAFVGNVTPVGHLLQLIAGIAQGVAALSRLTKLIIIDTPGFIQGPAAAALWWTVHQILKPALILAVQRGDELSDILAGLPRTNCRSEATSRTNLGGNWCGVGCRLEKVRCPAQIPTKSPPERCRYRQAQFDRYFHDSCLYNISTTEVAVQTTRRLSRESLLCRLVGLRDKKGADVAIGVITDLQQGGKVVIVKAPRLDVRQICCLVVGDITIDLAGAPG